ncbi:hypothetical protein [Mesorhizobium argentiipisi]|uniref:Uncharacterized protein n=1 Tax=Mesorhizobium argentiipisi TaxID=3015175 RepID=A0ABU8KE08_9HYPH
MLGRNPCWYVHLLGRAEPFSPQPYRQLAAVLRASGEAESADAILVAARDRELTTDVRDGAYVEAIGLGVLKYAIAYGVGSGLFRVLYWVVLFAALGAVVLFASKSGRRKGIMWCTGVSIDHLLPIVELNKEFAEFFDDPGRERLRGWQIGYFAVHALVGYLLASFLVAGLAGLTQTP